MTFTIVIHSLTNELEIVVLIETQHTIFRIINLEPNFKSFHLNTFNNCMILANRK